MATCIVSQKPSPISGNWMKTFTIAYDGGTYGGAFFVQKDSLVPSLGNTRFHIDADAYKYLNPDKVKKFGGDAKKLQMVCYHAAKRDPEHAEELLAYSHEFHDAAHELFEIAKAGRENWGGPVATC